jgi:sporulation protein YlmC with PRC-barrel domain
MANDNSMKKWSELCGLAVYVPKEGKSLGVIEDFFFKEGTNSVYALLVRTHVLGDYVLPVSAIKTIEPERVTIDNENLLIKAHPPLSRIGNLRGHKVMGESGTKVGTVGEIWLGINPPTALRVAAIELASPSEQHVHHPKAFTADAVAMYNADTIVIHDQVARKLR